ncbi:hypothetical protein MPTK1_1g16050 [Marchantia polymorpha subsp. ruderalis]|uniref:Uncharacterized protein n=2 Tax=Marchantia polymorpha TaxID=3197 RepID=A0AAF6AQP2_MARPO|nr:hypothetical protein MARPO_0033s0055 [Marchantia polymorpha]BBM98762.1 hypothetical protein Mp_1g16050 [Marchantia polymorpha subsp. ruderalis]|eukprot:PTQ41642.1 hypothetical protein MARPO_0033s0055 [Marchantia polymorpha]
MLVGTTHPTVQKRVQTPISHRLMSAYDPPPTSAQARRCKGKLHWKVSSSSPRKLSPLAPSDVQTNPAGKLTNFRTLSAFGKIISKSEMRSLLLYQLIT